MPDYVIDEDLFKAAFQWEQKRANQVLSALREMADCNAVILEGLLETEGVDTKLGGKIRANITYMRRLASNMERNLGNHA